jgi:hypothetical protein
MGKDMDLNFEIFMIVLLVLSIVVVGNFLRDGESNYLEGALLVVSSPKIPSALIEFLMQYPGLQFILSAANTSYRLCMLSLQ